MAGSDWGAGCSTPHQRVQLELSSELCSGRVGSSKVRITLLSAQATAVVCRLAQLRAPQLIKMQDAIAVNVNVVNEVRPAGWLKRPPATAQSSLHDANFIMLASHRVP